MPDVQASRPQGAVDYYGIAISAPLSTWKVRDLKLEHPKVAIGELWNNYGSDGTIVFTFQIASGRGGFTVLSSRLEIKLSNNAEPNTYDGDRIDRCLDEVISRRQAFVGPFDAEDVFLQVDRLLSGGTVELPSPIQGRELQAGSATIPNAG